VKVLLTISTIYEKSWKIIWHVCIWRGENLPIKLSRTTADITLYGKPIKIFYLIDGSIPNSSNLQITYTQKIRKYAELCIELKQQLLIKAVYT